MVRRRRRSGRARSPITVRNISRVQREYELKRELEEHVKRNDGLYGVLTAIAKLDADEKATARRLNVPEEDESSKTFENAILDYYSEQEEPLSTCSDSGSVSNSEIYEILDQISGDELDDVFSELISLNETETSSTIKDTTKHIPLKNKYRQIEGVKPELSNSKNVFHDLQAKRPPVKHRTIKSAIRNKSEHDDTKSVVTFQTNDDEDEKHIQYRTVEGKIPICRPKSAEFINNISKEHKHYQRQDSAYSATTQSDKSTDRNLSLNYSTFSRRKISSASRESTNDSHGHKSVKFDPELDKATKYIHGGGGQTFSSASKNLVPMKYGLRHLEMSYTETNLEHNPSVVFLDLLKSSHQTNHIRCGGIRNIEARLESRRTNPVYYTSFYEHNNLIDPFHRQTKSVIRTVAQKKKVRKEKIKKMTDEIHTGYVPTHLTMKIADQAEVEDIGRKVRYLRCNAPVETDDRERL